MCETFSLFLTISGSVGLQSFFPIKTFGNLEVCNGAAKLRGLLMLVSVSGMILIWTENDLQCTNLRKWLSKYIYRFGSQYSIVWMCVWYDVKHYAALFALLCVFVAGTAVKFILLIQLCIVHLVNFILLLKKQLFLFCSLIHCCTHCGVHCCFIYF